MSVLAVLADPARPMPDKAAPAFKRAIAAPRPPLRAGVLAEDAAQHNS